MTEENSQSQQNNSAKEKLMQSNTSRTFVPKQEQSSDSNNLEGELIPPPIPPVSENKDKGKPKVDLEQAIKLKDRSLKNELKEKQQDVLKNNLKKLNNEPPNKLQDKPESKLKEKQEETSLRTIRTYKDDLAQAMRQKKESLVSITAAENERRVKSGKFKLNNGVSRKQHLKKIGIVILSASLFVLGAGSAFYFYGKSGDGVVEPESKILSVVFSEEEEEFEITNLSRRQILNELTARKSQIRLSLGKIKNIFITESFLDKDGVQKRGLVSASNFLNAINVNIPTTFMRSLEPTFMLGVHVFDGNQPFLILKTSFYENAFTGMFGWEINIKEDLAPLFGPADFDVISGGDFGTSTPFLAIPVFSDFVVKNKDTRILKDSAGKTVLVYSFVDKNTIVITTNEDTFSEIVMRLTSSRILR